MIEVAAAVIIKNNRVFLASRPADKPPAGWEFPGGKLETGETPFEAVQRELLEELNWRVIPEKTLHTLKNDQIVLHFILCRSEDDSTLSACENQQYKWVDLTPLPPAGLLRNDVNFWKILSVHKINSCPSSL